MSVTKASSKLIIGEKAWDEALKALKTPNRADPKDALTQNVSGLLLQYYVLDFPMAS